MVIFPDVLGDKQQMKTVCEPINICKQKLTAPKKHQIHCHRKFKLKTRPLASDPQYLQIL